jgi:hypothetical protein
MGFFLKKLDNWALNHFNEQFDDLKNLHMACQIVIAEKLEHRIEKIKVAIKLSNNEASKIFKNEGLAAGKKIKFFEDASEKNETWLNICNLVEANIAEAYCHCMQAEDIKIVAAVDAKLESFIAEVKSQSFLYEPAIKEIKGG